MPQGYSETHAFVLPTVLTDVISKIKIATRGIRTT